MSSITIKTEDADRILKYLRNELETENKHYKECCDMCNKGNEKIPPSINEMLKILADKGHAHNVKILTEFIMILTVGSAESRLNNC